MNQPLSLADIIVTVEGEGEEGVPDLAPRMTADGTMEIPTDDGGVIIDLAPHIADNDDGDKRWGTNLATKLDPMSLGVIAGELMLGIAADETSREQWLATRKKGLELLGLELKSPQGGDGSAPLDGMSTVRDPVLLEAVIRFQANAAAELLPAAGPVKIRNDGPGNTASDRQAEALERDMNAYLTSTASEYYPDTKQMLLMVGFGGSGFKKVYHCPLRNRPVSDTVDANDLIVNNTAVDLRTASRVTHRVRMRRSDMRRMQILGVYRDVQLDPVQATVNQVDQQKAQIAGVSPQSQRPEDVDFELYECYCELDIPGFEHKDKKGKPTGLPIPYRVTIEKNSQQILEIVRNYDADDAEFPVARKTFVEYHYIKGFGFYGVGLLHILGNMAMALTGLLRIGIDAGMLGNFPGFLFTEAAGRQMTNQFRVPAGGGVGVKVDAGRSIKDQIMPLPYKEFGAPTMALMSGMREVAQRVGNVAEVQVGEGTQNAPVGTTLALIEQATKVEAAVHKGLHASQSEEFRILKDLFREDPEALWRHKGRTVGAWNRDTLLAALENYDLAPQADPNTPSHMQRLMKAVALMQLNGAFPGMFDPRKVVERVCAMAAIDNVDELYAPPQMVGAPPPDPRLIAAQAKMQDNQIKALTAQQTSQSKAMGHQLQAANIAAKMHDAEQERRHEREMERDRLISDAVIHNTPQSDIVGASQAVDQIIMPPDHIIQ